MIDFYKLLKNQHVKSIIYKYVINSPKYKVILINKYLLNFFRIQLCKVASYDYIIITYFDKFLFNIRWYISESYLKDIRTLNGHSDINEFLYRLQKSWCIGIFNSQSNWLETHFNIRFVLDNLGSSEEPSKEPSKELKCCFVYKDNNKDIYRLAISHEYIESNFFDKLVDCSVYDKFTELFRINVFLYHKDFMTLEEVYNTVVTLYKKFPKNYVTKDGFLVLKRD